MNILGSERKPLNTIWLGRRGESQLTYIGNCKRRKTLKGKSQSSTGQRNRFQGGKKQCRISGGNDRMGVKGEGTIAGGFTAYVMTLTERGKRGEKPRVM